MIKQTELVSERIAQAKADLEWMSEMMDPNDSLGIRPD
jgi:hypothetical protein